MNEKKDTNFGKTILDLARETYGDDFMFNQCTIHAYGEGQFTVTFDIHEKIEMVEGGRRWRFAANRTACRSPEPAEMSNFEKLSNLAKHRGGD
ncbi:MAG: hypothetical protein H8D67_18895 [Deltaproteobacteria bacterium]|nr:hypothetical protein [Deltaproteobacteria bacterium]